MGSAFARTFKKAGAPAGTSAPTSTVAAWFYGKHGASNCKQKVKA